MNFFVATFLLCLASSTVGATTTTDDVNDPTIVILADQSASILACPCTPDGACTTIFDTTPSAEEEVEDDDSLQRLCLWSSSTSEADLVSIDELTLLLFSETDDRETFVPLVPSPDISVNCAPQQQPEVATNLLCIVENIPLPAELFFDRDDGVTVTLTGFGDIRMSLETSLPSNSNLRGNNSTTTTNQNITTEEVVVERVEFHLQRGTENNETDGISLTTVALISGVAVLLQSSYFMIRYMYSRSKADLPA
jgi:hypothetical protein